MEKNNKKKRINQKKIIIVIIADKNGISKDLKKKENEGRCGRD
jgi:hypothetical protein